jgi:uncharacterized protein YbjT (DUF2867 family)
MQSIFITGGTGYIGSCLIPKLLKRGYPVKVLTRGNRINLLPEGCEIVTGNALDADSYKNEINPAEIFIHLVGVPHPSPAKKALFKSVDLVSIKEAVKAAEYAGKKHFIYLSVAQYPTSVMKDFQQVRAEGEQLLIDSGMDSTFVRPWYVLGPGHWWPLLLKPFYFIAKLFPKTREAALKLDTVTISQMINTLIYAVEHPAKGITAFEVQDIKSMQ